MSLLFEFVVGFHLLCLTRHFMYLTITTPQIIHTLHAPYAAIFQRKGGPAQTNQMAKKVFRMMLMSFLRTAQLEDAHLSECKCIVCVLLLYMCCFDGMMYCGDTLYEWLVGDVILFTAEPVPCTKVELITCDVSHASLSHAKYSIILISIYACSNRHG